MVKLGTAFSILLGVMPAIGAAQTAEAPPAAVTEALKNVRRLLPSGNVAVAVALPTGTTLRAIDLAPALQAEARQTSNLSECSVNPESELRDCVLLGVVGALVVAESVLDGNSALIGVNVVRGFEGPKAQSVSSSLYRVALKKQAGLWVVTNVKLIRES
jgi:hypothetical protein